MGKRIKVHFPMENRSYEGEVVGLREQRRFADSFWEDLKVHWDGHNQNSESTGSDEYISRWEVEFLEDREVDEDDVMVDIVGDGQPGPSNSVPSPVEEEPERAARRRTRQSTSTAADAEVGGGGGKEDESGDEEDEETPGQGDNEHEEENEEPEGEGTTPEGEGEATAGAASAGEGSAERTSIGNGAEVSTNGEEIPLEERAKLATLMVTVMDTVDMAAWFAVAVDVVEVSAYPDIVCYPCDLSLVKERLQNNYYRRYEVRISRATLTSTGTVAFTHITLTPHKHKHTRHTHAYTHTYTHTCGSTPPFSLLPTRANRAGYAAGLTWPRRWSST